MRTLRMHRCQAVQGYPQPSPLRIEVDDTIESGHPPMLHDEEAHELVSALRGALPGGTFDLVALHMMKAQCGLLIVSHQQLEASHSYQARVWAWVLEVFARDVGSNYRERALRFLEEAIELAQAAGLGADQAHGLVDYVFGRPKGEASKEVGWVMVTLASLCAAMGLDLNEAAQAELDRIWQPDVVDKVRRRQAEKRAQGFAVKGGSP